MFLRGLGARVTVSDTRNAVALADEIPALLDAGVMVESGGHGLLTFRRQDLIVVSPGVPLDTPEVGQVIGYGLPVIGELELASRYLKGGIVAVTGSNGRDDDDNDWEDLRRSGDADAGWRQYWAAGDRTGCREHG